MFYNVQAPFSLKTGDSFPRRLIMMQGEKEERREEGEQTYLSTHSGQKWVDRVLVPTWGVDEKTLDWVLLTPASQNVAEKREEEEAGASAHLRPLAAELKHGKHVVPGWPGSGTLNRNGTGQSGRLPEKTL